MKIKALFVLLLAVIHFSCGETKSSDDLEMSLENVDWLIGSWQDNVNGNQWEVWQKDSEGMQGRGMHIKKMDTSFFETMTIRLENNKLVFTATIKENEGPVKFIATSIKSDQVVFENPDHDFPKIITYSYIQDDNMLQAEVRAGEKGFTLLMFKR